jgi:hypothetical protein
MMPRTFASFLLAFALPLAALAPAAPALAQTAPVEATAAPVAVDGRFQRFVVTPQGHLAALVLQDGTVVHLPPHAKNLPVAQIRPGDAIHVEGVARKTPTGTMIARAVVKQNGNVIADASQAHGRRGHHDKDHAGGEEGKRQRPALAPVTASGRVAAVLASPRGRVHTVLLDDGTTASGFGLEALSLKVGDRVTVAGKGGAYPQGKALRIETITLPNGETRTLPARPHHGHRKAAQQQTPV